MSKVLTKVYDHHGVQVDILFSETAFFNATVAAKAFGKKVNDWLRLDSTKDYIDALIESRKCYVAGIPVSEQNQLVRIIQGGSNPTVQGTWLHHQLAIAYARWLNAAFSIWCDEIIYSMLHKKESPAYDPNFAIHTKRDTQIQNSKNINAVMFDRGGPSKIIAYNRMNCKVRTNKEPNEVVKIGRECGLKANECGSAKEVLRRVAPEKACGMSFADSLIVMGGDEFKSLKLSVKAEEIFAGILELGLTPAELLH